MSFKNLKKSSGNLERLAAEINKTSEYEKDSRFWYPERDKAGNAQAVIRFLPVTSKDEEKDGLPWVRLWTHGFQGPGGKWYIENSRTTLSNDKDPVGEYNSKLWAASEDDKSPERQQARKQKRKLNYISNIYVISDPKHPENEGKVFLYKYGKKIFDKITAAMNPEFEGDEPMDPFDLWKGANFKLRIRQVDGWPNYDQSTFESPSPLLGGDDTKLEEVYNKQYSLLDLVAPSQFKSYDELKQRLIDTLGFSPFDSEGNAQAILAGVATSTKKTVAAPASRPKADEVDVSTDEDDDDMARFRELAKDS